MDEGNPQSDTKPTTNPFFGTARQVMERYQHCALCGAYLHFRYYTDFSKNLTQENAKCPECGVEKTTVIHKLQ